MRLLEVLALVVIAACDPTHPTPKQAPVPAGSSSGSGWIHDSPGVLRDKILGVDGHVDILKNVPEFPEYRDVLSRVERTSDVVAAEPFIFAELMIAKQGKPPIGIAIKGVDPSRVGRVLALGQRMKAGTLESLGNTGEHPPMLIGDDLARTLDARVGDIVTVTSHENDPSGAPPVKPTVFVVVGLFHIGFDEYDGRLAFVPLPAIQAMLGRGDQVMGIELTVKDLAHSSDIAKALEKTLGGSPYVVMDWYELNKQLFTSMYGDHRP